MTLLRFSWRFDPTPACGVRLPLYQLVTLERLVAFGGTMITAVANLGHNGNDPAAGGVLGANPVDSASPPLSRRVVRTLECFTTSRSPFKQNVERLYESLERGEGQALLSAFVAKLEAAGYRWDVADKENWRKLRSVHCNQDDQDEFFQDHAFRCDVLDQDQELVAYNVLTLQDRKLEEGSRYAPSLETIDDDSDDSDNVFTKKGWARLKEKLRPRLEALHAAGLAYGDGLCLQDILCWGTGKNLKVCLDVPISWRPLKRGDVSLKEQLTLLDALGDALVNHSPNSLGARREHVPEIYRIYEGCPPFYYRGGAGERRPFDRELSHLVAAAHWNHCHCHLVESDVLKEFDAVGVTEDAVDFMEHKAFVCDVRDGMSTKVKTLLLFKLPTLEERGATLSPTEKRIVKRKLMAKVKALHEAGQLHGQIRGFNVVSWGEGEEIKVHLLPPMALGPSTEHGPSKDADVQAVLKLCGEDLLSESNSSRSASRKGERNNSRSQCSTSRSRSYSRNDEPPTSPKEKSRHTKRNSSDSGYTV